MNLFEEDDVQKVAIYSRVSTEEQALRGFSLEEQIDKLKKYCENYNLEVTGIYKDGGFSGRNTKRPEYQLMLDEIHKWDAILVLKMDRIHRNVKNCLEMMEQLFKKDKGFISFTEKIDTTTAMGRAMMTITLVFAQLESEQTGERIAFANIGKAKKEETRFMGHRVPFGYKWDKKKQIFIEKPEELEIVRQAFDLYSNGQVFDPIEKTSNGFINKVTGKKISGKEIQRLRSRYKAEGHSFRSVSQLLGKSDTSIRYYLNNIFYAGYERYCHYFRKLEDITPIITPDIWNKIQIKMRSNARSKNYDPIIIPEDLPKSFKLSKKETKMIPTISRAKHNYTF